MSSHQSLEAEEAVVREGAVTMKGQRDALLLALKMSKESQAQECGRPLGAGR